jgi:hypothetical protein
MSRRIPSVGLSSEYTPATVDILENISLFSPRLQDMLPVETFYDSIFSSLLQRLPGIVCVLSYFLFGLSFE